MWEFYGDLSGHVPHWRYEVGDKWYMGYIPVTLGIPLYISYPPEGISTKILGISGGNGVNTSIFPGEARISEETLRNWLHAAWVTRALNEYV